MTKLLPRSFALLAGAALLTAGFSRSAAAQDLVLDVSGGILFEPWNFSVTGTPPGQFWVVALADTTGPLPIAFIDPTDTRSFSLDISMFSYGGAYGTAPEPFPALQIFNNFPTLVGLSAKLYGQAFTLPGPTTLIDKLSNNVVIVVAGPHGTSTDCLDVPIKTRGFMPGAVMPNGDYIVFGGNDGALQGGTYLKTTERYDRKMQDVTSGPDMMIERAFAGASSLNNGKILVCGGNDDLNNTLTSAELYDPSTNTVVPTGSMAQKRYFHSIVKLQDGRVMVLGGSTQVDNTSPLNAALAIVSSATDSAEIYNPATGTWSNAAPMPWKRTGLAVSLLPNGRVLAATGAGPGLFSLPSFFNTAAIYNPATNTWSSTGSVPGSSRALASVGTLPDGRIVLSGGATGSITSFSFNAIADVSLFNPTTNTWAAGAAMSSPRCGHSVTALPTGALVVCGGGVGSVLAPTVLTSVENFDGSSWTVLGNMNHERAFHYAAPSHDGQRIFLYGGIETGGVAALQPTCELFAP